MVPWAWDMLVWRYRGKKEDERPEDPWQLYMWVQAEQVEELGKQISRAQKQEQAQVEAQVERGSSSGT